MAQETTTRTPHTITIPFDIDLRKLYRGYITVTEDTSDEDVREAIIQAVLNGDRNLILEEEFRYPERCDIEFIDLDHDGIMYED